MENVQHKYHAEVKSTDCLIRVNVFADDLQALFKDMDVLYEYMGYEQSPSVPAGVARPDHRQSPGNNGNGTKSACPLCGAVGTVELVKWNDKSTGQPRQAPKCRSCNKWLK
ncbi:MAG: hypothetical protein ABSG90_02430 [Dehalococcoidia bacterium]|jgi:hypothetical protein